MEQKPRFRIVTIIGIVAVFNFLVLMIVLAVENSALRKEIRLKESIENEVEIDGPKELMHSFDLVYKYYKKGYMCKDEFGEFLENMLDQYTENGLVANDHEIIKVFNLYKSSKNIGVDCDNSFKYRYLKPNE